MAAATATAVVVSGAACLHCLRLHGLSEVMSAGWESKGSLSIGRLYRWIYLISFCARYYWGWRLAESYQYLCMQSACSAGTTHLFNPHLT